MDPILHNHDVSVSTRASDTGGVIRAQEALTTFLSTFDPPKILQVRSFPDLLSGIIDEAIRITGAERGTIFLVDHNKGVLTSFIGHGLNVKEITLPIGSGIAGHVVKTREIQNYADAYKCPFFDPSFDAQTGFVTRAVLSAPIRNHDGIIIGVIQLLNKRPYFDVNDERFVKMYASYVAVSIENTQLYQEREKTFKSAIEMVTSAIDKRDPATAGHSSRVSKLSLLMARDLGLSEVEQTIIEYAGLLHDIGKIGVADAVLRKPGRLDDNEYTQIKRHATYTGDILHRMHWPEEWKDIPIIAAMHHERMDGSGYPNKCGPEEEIPLSARIIALADTYDALTAVDRTYRKALSHAKVIELIGQESERGLYDKEVYLTLKGIDLHRLQPIYGNRIYSE